MRSLEEIDADIAEVQARIAKRNEGMPNYGDPAYRAARFDYIVEGDRSGLDAYQNAVNAAIQNKLSRESSEQMMKAGKAQADDEAMYQWQKDYAIAKSAQREIMANKNSSEKDKRDAATNVKFYEDYGAAKGYFRRPDKATEVKEAKDEEEARKSQTRRESKKAKLGYYLGKDSLTEQKIAELEAENQDFFDKDNDAPYTGFEETYWDNMSKIDEHRKKNFNAEAKKYMDDLRGKLANKNIKTAQQVDDIIKASPMPEGKDYSTAEGWDKFQSEIENQKKGFRDSAAERANRAKAANNIKAEAVLGSGEKTIKGSAGGKSYVFDIEEDTTNGELLLTIGGKVYRRIKI